MAAELTDSKIIATALSMGMWGVQGVRPSGETFITGMGDGVIKTVRSLLATQQSAQGAEPVAKIVSWTGGSYWRNYKVEWTDAGSSLAEGTLLYTAPPPTAEVEKLHALLQHETPDAIRFRFLCDDHADRETREKVRGVIDRLPVMSISAAREAIDAITSWPPVAALQSDQAQAGNGNGHDQ